MPGEQLFPEVEPSAGARLHERLVYWSEFAGQASEAAFAEHAQAAIMELDGLWEQQGLMHAVCMVNGYGSWSRQAERTEEDAEAGGIAEGLPQ